MRARMSQDQFLLKWNNHQNNFVEVFNYLRTQDAFVDVTLACDGKSFSAHKVVLSACSPYFQALFQTSPCKHPIVFLKDVKGADMEALIEFIYKGEVSISQTELGSLISTAENLKIKGLAEPDRPIEKAVKHRLASPPRVQTIAQTLTTAQLQHNTPVALYHQSATSLSPSPSAKRKRCDTYPHAFVSATTTTATRCGGGVGGGGGGLVGVDKEDKLTLNSLADGHIHREISNAQSQVVLLPTQDAGGTVADLSPQGYGGHASISTSDGVLYSVAGTAIYVGAAANSTGGRAEIVREVYQTEQLTSEDEIIAGPSGIQNASNDSAMEHSIKLEPSGPVSTEGWDGSNQSYDDGAGTGSDGGGGSVGVATPTGSSLGNSVDPLSLTIPLHTDLDTGQLHESARGTCVASVVRCHDMSTYGNGGVTATVTVTSTDPGQTENGIKSENASISGSRRLLECEHCHKQFTSRFNLQRHQLIHTGAKPYECPLCHQRFNQSGHVKTHLRTRHPSHDIQVTCDSNSMNSM